MQESHLMPEFPSKIKKFWLQGDFLYFSAFDDIRINYAQFIHNKNDKCLVIVSGRSETYLKYMELSFDLYQQGYNIFLLDHRGQGLSERLLSNPHKGYVANFDDYESDLSYFIDHVVASACPMKPYLLAHSMGGLIAARYLQKKTKKNKKYKSGSALCTYDRL